MLKKNREKRYLIRSQLLALLRDASDTSPLQECILKEFRVPEGSGEG